MIYGLTVYVLLVLDSTTKIIKTNCDIQKITETQMFGFKLNKII